MADKEKYMIKVEGKLVEVTPEVYYAYFRMERQERGQEEKKAYNKVVSYDALDDEEKKAIDNIPDVAITSMDEIVIANKNGRAIRFNEDVVRSMGRTATGVKGMILDEDGQDEVIGMVCVHDFEKETIMVVSEQGFGKRSDINDYRKTNRGGKGVKTMNITDKTGKLVAIKVVTDDNDLMIINKSGITIRLRVRDVRVMGRATQGVKLINLGKRNDTISSVCQVPTDSENNNAEDIQETKDNSDSIAQTENNEMFN